MSINNLQKILNEIDYPVLIEIIDYMWCGDFVEKHWNTDNNLSDLVEGEGNTYSVESIEGEAEYDGYLVINGDNGCGETVTYFFNLSKEVKF